MEWRLRYSAQWRRDQPVFGVHVSGCLDSLICMGKRAAMSNKRLDCAASHNDLLGLELSCWSIFMSSRHIFALAGSLILVGVSAQGFDAHAKGPRPAMARLDTDHDGTADLNEAKAAASAEFDALDRDHDGTLDRKELAGRVSASDFAKADPDNDGTLTKEEYLALVEQRFRAANPDADDTLEARELRTAAGQALLRLVR